MPRYILSVEDGEKASQRALSEASRQKRRETWQAYREQERQAVLGLRCWGLAPLAIADELGLSDTTVPRYLRELEAAGEIEPAPSYLTRVFP